MTETGRRKPEWAGEGEGFTCSVMDGVTGGHDGLPGAVARPRFQRRRPTYSEAQMLAGVRAADRTVLGRVLSLIESNADHHMELAQNLLRQLLPETGGAIRIGITGVPGAGKSTFIDAFGSLLCDQGHRVAVLAVDPSSTLTRGSILGDKTRMERLSRHPNAFIRPSPTGGTLGGVSRKTRETMLLCEAAGFDVILVETVGVGQSEATVRSMTDFFMLLTLTGAGDDLQGIKRGVMENADAIVINKADGDNRTKAERLGHEFTHALRYLKTPTPGWQPKAFLVSALEKEGLDEVWAAIERFREITADNDFFETRRHEQVTEWMMSMVLDQVQQRFLSLPRVQQRLPGLKREVMEGKLPATAAARELLNTANCPLFSPKTPEKDSTHDSES
ncbi:MAG: methylmalonyl Co-A mutase-associated GTPase MeaB [Verrucomicrobia bacterium]|nr:methylmalonyl Co-A mutase-associated GTPase MeaB [Verrucomicrobiota bacterium]MCH8511592.1 methylmalonyl Co-A mutase-associated GTPase MeaB [Kiritimatiellia bacterium]